MFGRAYCCCLAVCIAVGWPFVLLLFGRVCFWLTVCFIVGFLCVLLLVIVRIFVRWPLYFCLFLVCNCCWPDMCIVVGRT